MAYKKVKYWIDEELAKLLSDKIVGTETDFPKEQFVTAIAEGISELEFKDRVELFADELYEAFGADYEKGVYIQLQTLGEENPNETGMFTEYYWVMPFAKYVEKYGLAHYELSIHAMLEITKRNTSEYAIRPYLEKYTDKTLAKMLDWSKDENFHIRRLASEGGRPRLPWASKLDIFIEQPQLLFPILDNLKDDPVKFVQKSVANCVNDVLKDNEAIAKEWIDQWRKGNISKERKWIIKHALRKLRKAEEEWAMEVVSQL
ncbi:MAG: DNA alkylation repair protein [Bacteroidota bacterium]